MPEPLPFEKLLTKYHASGTSADIAYAVLRHGIIHGELALGSRMRADELAKHLGMSRTPIREALRKLEAEELIVVGPRNVLVVQELSQSELVETYYIREALEGMAARLTAENISQFELSNLRHVISSMTQAVENNDLDTLRELTGEFQILVFEASRNQRLLRMLKELHDRIRRFRISTTYLDGRSAEIFQEFQNLFTAIENRDPDEAERCARQHRRRTLELRMKMYRDNARDRDNA